MIIKNKLDRTFGPFGSSTGFFLMIGGVITTYFSLLGLFIAVFGALAAFTTTCTLIDTEKKRIKYGDELFGFIPAGKWIQLRPDMKLGLKKSHRGFVGYIRGTQPVGIHYNDIRITLFDSNNKPILPVKKIDSKESSEIELNNLCTLLQLKLNHDQT
jgi:hypothetical protein